MSLIDWSHAENLLPILTWDQQVACSLLISILIPVHTTTSSIVIFRFNCLLKIKHMRQPGCATWSGAVSTYSTPGAE
jgi:hypothetical protein